MQTLANRLEEELMPVMRQKEADERKTMAREWLYEAKRDMETTELLMDASHYVDIIGSSLHSALSKIFMAVLVYHEGEVCKTHDLNLLREKIKPYFALEDFKLVELLEDATGYYHGRFQKPDNDKLRNFALIESTHHLTNILFADISRLLGIRWRRLCRM